MTDPLKAAALDILAIFDAEFQRAQTGAEWRVRLSPELVSAIASLRTATKNARGAAVSGEPDEKNAPAGKGTQTTARPIRRGNRIIAAVPCPSCGVLVRC